ncbi:MAG: hypothetical protein GF405_00260 [Candidatus Eisenbacteria bacterium]|nr:hypothetical protein [Candidatus Eisenbacteria bacterium]
MFAVTVSSAFANPVWNDEVVVEFSDGQNCVWPHPGQVITARVVLTEPGYAQDGITAFAFRIDRTFGGFVVETRNLLGGLMIGSLESEGVSVGAATCVTPDGQGRIPIVEIDYFYDGMPGLLSVLWHVDEGATFVDCDQNYHTWYNDSERNVGGVGMEPPGGCYESPVAEMSWGAVKALYR